MDKGQILSICILSLTGLFVWLIIAETSNNIEAWDSMYYYLIGLPVMCGASAIAGYLNPKSPWIYGISVIILQPFALLFQSEMGPLVVVGLVVFGFFAAFTVGSAYIGAGLRKKT